MKLRHLSAVALAASCLAALPASAAVTSSVTGGTLLTVSSDAGDTIAVACATGQVRVNGADPGSGPASCAGITSIVVNGGPGDNVLTLVDVLAADYPALATVVMTGGAGADTITGSFLADTLAGGAGNDPLVGDNNPAGTRDTADGGDDSDTMVWNPGDGDDVNEGGAGTDIVLVNGAGAGETFAIAPDATVAGRVRFDRTLPTAFSIDIGTSETLRLNAGAGNDTVTGANGLAALIALELNGGDGDDTITGGDGADTIHGDLGNDVLDGNDNPAATLDQVFGDDGNDTMTWNPGKDDDRNEGGAGTDVSVINGAGAAETFTIAASGGRVRFDRTLPTAFFVDIGSTETLRVNAGGGNDSITGGAGLAALIALELNGGDGDDTIVGGDGADVIHGNAGNDALDGNDNPVATLDQVFGDDGDDTMTWNPGKDDDFNEGGAGNDVSVIVGGGAAETFTIAAAANRVRLDRTSPAPFFVDIGTTETLRVNGNAGNDSITGNAGLAALIALELNGGDGDDTITGGDGADLISGGVGNDVLDGGDNPAATLDQVSGNDGDDTMVWNPGKDDDRNDGGAGNDTSLINAAGAAETFAITQQGARVRFDRSLPTAFFVDISGDTETLRLVAGAGADTVSTQPLLTTAQLLEGGDPTALPGDTLTVQGVADPSISPVLVPGFQPITHTGFEFAANGGTISGTTFNDVDRDGLREAADTALANVNVFADADNDRVLDAGEVATLSAANGSYTLTFAADTTARVRAVLPANTLHTGTDAQPISVFGGNATAGVDLGFVTIVPGTSGLTGALDGAQEVPPITTNASGRGTVVLNAARTQITVRLAFSNLSANATLAHIHGPAAVGAEAAPIFDLPLGGSTTSGEIGPLTFAVTPQQAADALAGLWYFNVHTSAAPEGEIRGQIRADRVIEAFLDGRQEVPPAATSARGFGTVTLAGPEDRILVTLRYSGLVADSGIGTSTLAHIHGAAARGTNAAPIVDLRVSGSDNDAFATAEIAVTPQRVIDLKAGRLYFNVHSTEFPQGEIRGQIDDVHFGDGFE